MCSVIVTVTVPTCADPEGETGGLNPLENHKLIYSLLLLRGGGVSVFCYSVLCHSCFAIVLIGKRELVVLL